MKKFLSGFIAAAILFSISPVSAAIEEYIIKPNRFPINVNGQETKIEALNINDFTYVKLADVSKALGGTVGVKFNKINEKIEINSVATVTTPNEISAAMKNSNKPTSTPDGITEIDAFEGEYYIGWLYIKNKLSEKGYSLTLLKGGLGQIKNGDVVLLDNIPTKITYGYNSVTYNYYVDIILPLIK